MSAIQCPNCKKYTPNEYAECLGCGKSLYKKGEYMETSVVQINGTTVRVNANTVAEAKLAIKELKLKKKEFTLSKKAVNERQKEIRASYTQEVRTRGSMVRGGGGIGKFIRAFQTASRDNTRAQLAYTLAPLEQEKQNIEAMIRVIDSAILQIEAQLIRHT